MRGEFSVGECAGSALPELHIGRGVKKPRLPVFLDIPLSVLDAAAPLEEERPVTVLRQHQRAEKSRGTGPDHDGAALHLLTALVREAVRLRVHGRDLSPAKFRRELSVRAEAPAQIHIHRVDIEELGLFAGVHRVPADLITKRLSAPEPESFSYFALQSLPAVPAGKFHLGNSYHLVPLLSFAALLPAIHPLVIAHCRLYPPQIPSTSRSSPAR